MVSWQLDLKNITQTFSQIFSVIHFTAWINLSNYFAAKFTLLEIILHFDADYLSIAENEGISFLMEVNLSKMTQQWQIFVKTCCRVFSFEATILLQHSFLSFRTTVRMGPLERVFTSVSYISHSLFIHILHI